MTPVDQMIIPDFDIEADESPVTGISWLQTNLSLSDDFFAKVAAVEETDFSKWKQGDLVLEDSKIEGLKALSSALTHMLSFLNFRHDLMITLFEFKSEESKRTPLTPPWAGNSLKQYLQTHGVKGVEKVDLWVQRMRWTDWS